MSPAERVKEEPMPAKKTKAPGEEESGKKAAKKAAKKK